MNKYAIKLTRYTEAGAPTSDISYVYADTPQGLASNVEKYKKMRYTSTDPETGETTVGFSMYNVEPYQGEYAKIDDWARFVEVNACLYNA